MSKAREVLRLRWALERSVRETARSTGASCGVVSATESRARRAGMDWAAVEGLDDEQLDWTAGCTADRSTCEVRAGRRRIHCGCTQSFGGRA